MTKNITILSLDTIRTMITDTEVACGQMLGLYNQAILEDPDNEPVQEQTETINQFREDLSRWKVRFQKAFGPLWEQDQEQRYPVKYLGENHRTSPNAVSTLIYRPQSIQQDTLDPRHDLVNHSPTGFGWGYNGSGPAQLALAILAHHTGNDNYARVYHQDFKKDVISKLPMGGPWAIEEETGRRLGQGPPARPTQGTGSRITNDSTPRREKRDTEPSLPQNSDAAPQDNKRRQERTQCGRLARNSRKFVPASSWTT